MPPSVKRKPPVSVPRPSVSRSRRRPPPTRRKPALQGEGQANYRREIANGIVDQIKSLQAVGMNINDVNNVVLFNQYLDVMRSLSESNNTKTVVLPASTPGGYQDLYEQVTKAMLTASETNDAAPAAGK